MPAYIQTNGFQVVTYLLQIAILGIFLRSIRRHDTKVEANAGGALFVSVIPYLLESQYHLHIGWPVPFWITMAGFLHTLGARGFYTTFWWWDHLAHTVSGGLVAAITAGIVLVVRESSNAGTDTTVTIGGLVVGFVVGWGIFWELLEYFSQRVSLWLDNSVMLTQDGSRDAVLDVSFNLLGAGIVLSMPSLVFTPLVRQVPLVDAAFLHTLLVVVVGLDVSFGVVIGCLLLFGRLSHTADRG